MKGTTMPETKTPAVRRSRKQIAADENAVINIAQEVRGVDRWNPTSLRNALDAIGDLLVAAGRL
jgi:hypothetical protein